MLWPYGRCGCCTHAAVTLSLSIRTTITRQMTQQDIYCTSQQTSPITNRGNDTSLDKTQVKANQKQNNINPLRDQPTKYLKEIMDHLRFSNYSLRTTKRMWVICAIIGALISSFSWWLWEARETGGGRGLSGLHWAWCIGRGPQLQLRQEPQATSDFTLCSYSITYSSWHYT